MDFNVPLTGNNKKLCKTGLACSESGFQRYQYGHYVTRAITIVRRIRGRTQITNNDRGISVKRFYRALNQSPLTDRVLFVDKLFLEIRSPHETDVSTKQSKEKPKIRLSFSHENQRWPGGSYASPTKRQKEIVCRR